MARGKPCPLAGFKECPLDTNKCIAFNGRRCVALNIDRDKIELKGGDAKYGGNSNRHK